MTGALGQPRLQTLGKPCNSTMKPWRLTAKTSRLCRCIVIRQNLQLFNLKMKSNCTYMGIHISHAHNFKFTEKLVLFGKWEIIITDKIYDFIILVAKFYIYRCKVQTTNLNLKIFIAELYKRFLVEKHINKDSLVFRCLWAPYKQLFQLLMTI